MDTLNSQLDILISESQIKLVTWGGYRPNAGRKPDAEKLVLRGIQEKIDQHALEKESVFRKGEWTERERLLIILDVLSVQAIRGNVSAAREYFDRTLGKPAQALVHNPNIKEQEIEKHKPKNPAALVAALEAYYEALDKMEYEDEN